MTEAPGGHVIASTILTDHEGDIVAVSCTVEGPHAEATISLHELATIHIQAALWCLSMGMDQDHEGVN
jgi:hypothetical protein